MANDAKQLMTPVIYGGEKMSALEAWKLVKALPPDFPLTTDEAALFLRTSVSTLERLRANGGGPDYVQAGAPASKGKNQKVTYYKQALEAWQQANTVSGAMPVDAAAVRSFTTIFDLAEALPFYIEADGSVESMAEDNTVAVAVERLGVWSLLWMAPVEAAARRWSSLAEHRAFAGRIQSALSAMQAGIAQALDDTDVAESMKG